MVEEVDMETVLRLVLADNKALHLDSDLLPAAELQVVLISALILMAGVPELAPQTPRKDTSRFPRGLNEAAAGEDRASRTEGRGLVGVGRSRRRPI